MPLFPPVSKWVWETRIDPPIQSHEVGAVATPFYRRENRLQETKELDHSYLTKKGARLDLNLGLSDFKFCVLNGLIAKVPLGDNLQPLMYASRKRDSAGAAPPEDQGAPVPMTQLKGDCYVNQWGQKL